MAAHFLSSTHNIYRKTARTKCTDMNKSGSTDLHFCRCLFLPLKVFLHLKYIYHTLFRLPFFILSSSSSYGFSILYLLAQLTVIISIPILVLSAPASLLIACSTDLDASGLASSDPSQRNFVLIPRDANPIFENLHAS